MFHSMAAVAFRHSEKFQQAVFHFKRAIQLSQNLGIVRFEAINYNNLSLLYKSQEKYSIAHSWADRAYALFNRLNDAGWLPHVLDTKALIYLDEKKYTNSLVILQEALTYFYQGEDYNGLTSALWTKVLVLLRLKRNEEAYSVFGELQYIAKEKIGEAAVKKFTKKFDSEVFVVNGLALKKELAVFKKSRIVAALQTTNGSVSRAAKLLGLSHQSLSNMLKTQFPEIYEELGMERRTRLETRKTDKVNRSRSIILESSNIFSEREISLLETGKRKMSFKFKHFSKEVYPYYFDEYFMELFGISDEAVVAITPVTQFEQGKLVLVYSDNIFTLAEIEHDRELELFVIYDEFGVPILLDEENVLGEPIGYCLFDEMTEENIVFSKF
jgi:tetratricopeptide (TPR) repeat protein